MVSKESKKERRLQRQVEKKLKEKNNNARLAQSVVVDKSKPIRVIAVPDLEKSPRLNPQEINYKDCTLSWGVTHADREGMWSWGETRAWDDEEYNQDIKSHFESLVNNSWREIEAHTYNGKDGNRKLLNKYQPVESICGEARNRWVEDELRVQFEELLDLG